MTITKRRSVRQFLSWWMLCWGLACSAASPTPIADRDLQKVEPEVIEDVNAGRTSLVLLTIDDSEIFERFEKKRSKLKTGESDQELIRLMSEELSALKAEIFPKGQMGSIRVVENYPHLPMVAVKIRGMHELNQLVSHPKILMVHKNQVYKPSLLQSLPIVSQPQAVATGTARNPHCGARYRVSAPRSRVLEDWKGARLPVPWSI